MHSASSSLAQISQQQRKPAQPKRTLLVYWWRRNPCVTRATLMLVAKRGESWNVLNVQKCSTFRWKNVGKPGDPVSWAMVQVQLDLTHVETHFPWIPLRLLPHLEWTRVSKNHWHDHVSSWASGDMFISGWSRSGESFCVSVHSLQRQTQVQRSNFKHLCTHTLLHTVLL